MSFVVLQEWTSGSSVLCKTNGTVFGLKKKNPWSWASYFLSRIMTQRNALIMASEQSSVKTNKTNANIMRERERLLIIITCLTWYCFFAAFMTNDRKNIMKSHDTCLTFTRRRYELQRKSLTRKSKNEWEKKRNEDECDTKITWEEEMSKENRKLFNLRLEKQLSWRIPSKTWGKRKREDTCVFTFTVKRVQAIYFWSGPVVYDCHSVTEWD